MSKLTKYARVAEWVNIVACHEFVRCGYPLCVKDILNDRKDSSIVEAKVLKLMKVLNTQPKNSGNIENLSVLKLSGVDLDIHLQQRNTCSGRVHGMLSAAVATHLLQERNFGGNERIIVEKKLEDPKFYIDKNPWLVVRKKIVKTGTRYAPSFYGYGEDYEYEPGGLHNEQTHCVYQLQKDAIKLWVLAKHCRRLR